MFAFFLQNIKTVKKALENISSKTYFCQIRFSLEQFMCVCEGEF